MRALVFLSVSLITACSATASRSSGGTSGGGGSGFGATSSSTVSGSGGVVTATSSSGAGTGGGISFDGGLPDANPTGPAEVFGETATTLYKLDPVTNVVSVVADFQGCGTDGVIDLALDKSGNMFVTTFSGFYAVEKTTAVCTHIMDGSYPNSLSFVPQGTLDPNVEALVGYNGADYVRIDPTTGAVTTVAAGILGDYSSSGDVVSVIGGGTYLTVTGPNCGDCIIEVDPSTGALTHMIGSLGHSAVYGLAFWGGSAYGFDAEGDVFQINLTTAATTLIQVPMAPPNLSWYGAGSTTSAPLTPTQ